ncbi:efflux RND transporter periplasmic adaptor subunit [Pseudoroseomonas sp. WGS1072]|uniref:efflux RND transporter periplasmic adaptor subunit n=1 Tax=Roseomonas sp. WGS1072 TaxID=3366816 RepID=UPI003BF033D2
MLETSPAATARRAGPPAPARWRRRWLPGLLLLLAAAAAGWYLLRPAAGPPPVPPLASPPLTAAPPPVLTVATAPVVLRPMERLVVGDGSVVPWQELVLGAEAGGLRVEAVLVEEGDAVRAGQVLARMDDRLPAAQLGQAEAGVAEAEAALDIARTDLRRAEELARSQNTPRQVLDQRRAAARQAEARLAAARASREELAARLAQARLLAPADGIVLRRAVLPGTVLTAGQEMFRLLREGRLELDARVPELDLSQVRPGQAVRIRHGERLVEGRVRAVAPGVAPESRLGTVHVALGPDAGLRPGMFARAEIGAGARDWPAVPHEAVVFRDGGPVAFVLEGEQVRLRRLATGPRDGGWIAVESGLAAGERVVVRGAGFLADGDRVRSAGAD